MHLKPKRSLVLLILHLHASIYLPTLFCATPNCSNEAFDCGSITHLAYPFWGGPRPQECGLEGFQIVCDAGVPMLNISSLSYRVLEIDFNNNTLKVARHDLWNNTCPDVLLNTTIDHPFEHPPKSNENVTLYYDCTDHHDPSKFNCFGSSHNLFLTGGESSRPNITCKHSIFVPINKEAAQSLQNPTTSTTNILKSALASGFSVQWSAVKLQSIAIDPFQRSCTKTGCDRQVAPHKRSCSTVNTCGRGTGALGGGPVAQPRESTPPVQSPSNSSKNEGPIAQTGKGIPPVQSPSSSSKDEGPIAQTGKGIPPVQSPAYFPQTGKGMPPVQAVGYPPRAGIGRNVENYPGKKLVIVMALGIIGAITLSFIIGCFLRRRLSASGPNRECNKHVENFLLQHRSLAPKRYKYSEIKKMTKSFTDKLGKGGYGSVYKGTLPDGHLVAVKVLNEIDSNGEEFINEVASISRTSHVNIVTLLGFCYEGNKRALVYEYMPNKSLDKFLNNNGSADNADCCLDLEKLYKIAVGIAKGLEYLHTGCTTRIVHFDIKPQNILLDEDLRPKISDFGLAKLCKKKQSILSVFGLRGTIGYIAPEVFSRNFGGASHKSDVYSYGMMVLEMAGAKKLVESEVIQSSENYFPDKIYEQVILNVATKLDDFMIKEEGEIKKKMFLVGFWCIQTNPIDRPSITKVVEMLEGSLQSIQIPPKPYLFAPSFPVQEISSSFSEHVETENSA